MSTSNVKTVTKDGEVYRIEQCEGTRHVVTRVRDNVEVGGFFVIMPGSRLWGYTGDDADLIMRIADAAVEDGLVQ